MITGTVLAGIICGAIALGFAVWIILASIFSYDPEAAWLFGGIFGGILAIVSAICFIPYQAEYLHYETVSGEVEQIKSMRLEQRFAITFEGDPQPYKITDTRAALVEPGDDLTLECVKEWEWGSTNHGFNCKWGSAS